MKEYADMNEAELNDELGRLKDLLEDVIEEKEWILNRTTGLHRSVSRQVQRYETEIPQIEDKIAALARLLKERSEAKPGI